MSETSSDDTSLELISNTEPSPTFTLTFDLPELGEESTTESFSISSPFLSLNFQASPLDRHLQLPDLSPDESPSFTPPDDAYPISTGEQGSSSDQSSSSSELQLSPPTYTSTTLLDSSAAQMGLDCEASPSSAILPYHVAATSAYIRGHMRATQRRPTMNLFWTPSVQQIPPSYLPNFENFSIGDIIERHSTSYRALFMVDATARMMCSTPEFMELANPDQSPEFSCFQLVHPVCYPLCGVFKNAIALNAKPLRGVSIDYTFNGTRTPVYLNLAPVMDASNCVVALHVKMVLASEFKQ